MMRHQKLSKREFSLLEAFKTNEMALVRLVDIAPLPEKTCKICRTVENINLWSEDKKWGIMRIWRREEKEETCPELNSNDAKDEEHKEAEEEYLYSTN